MFLGFFVGWSINNCGNLSLQMPSAFWNRVVLGGADYVYTMEDLESMDVIRYNELMDLKTNAKALSQDDFDAVYGGMTYEADFSGKEMTELCPGGAERMVTKDMVDEYVQLYLKKYSEQDRIQF